MKPVYSLFLLTMLLAVFSCGGGDDPIPNPSASYVDFTVSADGSRVTLTWNATESVDIYRKIGSADFVKVASGVASSPYIDNVENAADNDEVTYRMTVAGGSYTSSEVINRQQSVRIALLSDEELLDVVQKQTLKYFYDFAHPRSGMARERDTSGDIVTTGGTGFGVMALIAGSERGFISRNDAYGKIRSIVDFLSSVKRFHGAYAHWYNGSTGAVVPFSEKDDGGDLVETALLFQGLLAAHEYFASGSAEEQQLSDDIQQLWADVDWASYVDNGNLMWHWSENYGFAMNLPIQGWNEAMIVYVLAASAPNSGYAIDSSLYASCFQQNGGIKNGNSYYDITLPLGDAQTMGGPLFFAHYSFLGLDPRNLSDGVCANYFEQNRNHALINRAYCMANPKGYAGYSENLWGLTSCDCPVEGYGAHSPANDDGTIAPTAALSSMPYTPDESMAVLRYLYRSVDGAFGDYGFYDAVNLSANGDKVVKSYLAIDQGPIVVMIENYRSQLLWKLFMENDDVKRGLQRLGFSSPTYGI